MNFSEFNTKVTKGKDRVFKVNNSIGVYDVYKKMRKNHWYSIGRPVKEHEFYTIIRSVNNLLADNISRGESITFPAKMGTLELKKYEPSVGIVNGKLKIGYPIDWNGTLHLWHEDEEAYKNKILLRHEVKYLFKVRYDKFRADYENKVFYDFALHQKVKKALKENIKLGVIDTLW